MAKVIILLLMSFISFTAHSAIYKCVVNGVETYSQDPCGNKAEEVILPKDQNVISRPVPTDSETVIDEEMTEKKAQVSQYVHNQRIAREIEKLEGERERVFKKRDQQIEALKATPKRGIDDLARATWEQSLAQEMTAVTQAAESRITSIDRQIAHLRKEVLK